MIRKSHGIALAALTLAASTAMAAGPAPVVKVYGLLDAGIGSVKTASAPGTSSQTQVASGYMTTSFLGFDVSKDVGSGLKVEGTLETFLAVNDGANLPNNAGQFWGRTSNLSLSGGFGKVAIGQYDNPLFTFGYTYNPFGSSMVLSPTMRHYNYVGQTSHGAGLQTGVGFDTGWVNSVTYESPTVSGFSGVAQIAVKNSTTANTKDSYTLAGYYNQGAISAGLVYVDSGVSDYANAGNVLSAPTYKEANKVVALGGSYDFGKAKAFAQYTDIKGSSLAGVEQYKDKVLQVGGSFSVGAKGAILASYGQSKTTPTGGTAVTDKVLSLAYDCTVAEGFDAYGGVMQNSQTTLESGTSVVIGARYNF